MSARGEREAKGPRLWLRRGDQVFVAACLAAGLVFVCVHWLKLSNWGRQTVEVERLPAAQYQYAVDINSATWVEWAQFDGIGEALAKRIVADRETRGRFRDVKELLRVRGIGPKKLAQMRPYLTIEPEQATAEREQVKGVEKVEAVERDKNVPLRPL
jgi:competence protein ComEA